MSYHDQHMTELLARYHSYHRVNAVICAVLGAIVAVLFGAIHREWWNAILYLCGIVVLYWAGDQLILHALLRQMFPHLTQQQRQHRYNTFTRRGGW
jgi:hypothetical protein